MGVNIPHFWRGSDVTGEVNLQRGTDGRAGSIFSIPREIKLTYDLQPGQMSFNKKLFVRQAGMAHYRLSHHNQLGKISDQQKIRLVMLLHEMFYNQVLLLSYGYPDVVGLDRSDTGSDTGRCSYSQPCHSAKGILMLLDLTKTGRGSSKVMFAPRN